MALPDTIELFQADPQNESWRNWCYVCGRKVGKSSHHLRQVNGGGEVAVDHSEPAWDNDPGDLAYWPVGSECLKKLPATAVTERFPVESDE